MRDRISAFLLCYATTIAIGCDGPYNIGGPSNSSGTAGHAQELATEGADSAGSGTMLPIGQGSNGGSNAAAASPFGSDAAGVGSSPSLAMAGSGGSRAVSVPAINGAGTSGTPNWNVGAGAAGAGSLSPIGGTASSGAAAAGAIAIGGKTAAGGVSSTFSQGGYGGYSGSTTLPVGTGGRSALPSGGTKAAGGSANTGSLACSEPRQSCGIPATCVDPQTDPANCGACGNACGTNQQCTAGSCHCALPFLMCGTECVDTQKSNAHCGGCSRACTGSQMCSGGACQSGEVQVLTRLTALPASPNETTSSVQAALKICNTGSTAIKLGGAKLTYWYSMDGGGGEQITETYATTTSGITLAAVAVEPMRGTTDYSVVATLPTTYSLAPKSTATPDGCTSEIQMVVHAGPNWNRGYVIANDWSYLGTTEYKANDRVTLTLGNETLWGNAPPSS